MELVPLPFSQRAKRFIKNYKFSFVVIVFGALYLPLAAGYDLDFFEHLVFAFHYVLALVDNSDFIEVIPVMMFVIVAVYADLVRLRRKTRRQRDDVQ